MADLWKQYPFTSLFEAKIHLGCQKSVWTGFEALWIWDAETFKGQRSLTPDGTRIVPGFRRHDS